MNNNSNNGINNRNNGRRAAPYQLNPEFNPRFRRVTTNALRGPGTSSLPQIAIKRKDNNSPSTGSTEVVLLNGNWDTSYKIPNIIAEMHNVDIDELQAFQNGGKQMKIETDGMIAAAVPSTPSPIGSDSGIEGDCSDGNLSWLLNYKINELPPVPDCPVTDGLQKVETVCAPPQISFRSPDQQVQFVSDCGRVYAQPPQEKLQQPQPYRQTGPKKPPFTYTELIEYALVEKGELTVSGIYQWISDHFPFYKQNDDRWKNSVRHNLSINPHFRKGSKAVHGAGHLWTIAQKEDQKTWSIKKQRMQHFIQTTMTEYSRQIQQELELATATASILPPDHGHQHGVSNHTNNSINIKDLKRLQPQNVEVEYVIDMSGGLGDFLCPPVSKEQVAEECGLGGDYLITDLNPATLGLNLTDAEIINGANLYEDLNFQCYELQAD